MFPNLSWEPVAYALYEIQKEQPFKAGVISSWKDFEGIVNVTLRLICSNRKSSDALQAEKKGYNRQKVLRHSVVHETETKPQPQTETAADEVAILFAFNSCHKAGLTTQTKSRPSPGQHRRQVSLIARTMGLNRSWDPLNWLDWPLTGLHMRLSREGERQWEMETLPFSLFILMWTHFAFMANRYGHMCVVIIMKLWGLLSKCHTMLQLEIAWFAHKSRFLFQITNCKLTAHIHVISFSNKHGQQICMLMQL